MIFILKMHYFVKYNKGCQFSKICTCTKLKILLPLNKIIDNEKNEVKLMLILTGFGTSLFIVSKEVKTSFKGCGIASNIKIQR